MSSAQSPARKSLGIIGASGKLAFATLQALLSQNILPAGSIVCTTTASSSSAPQHAKLSALGVTVRHATFDDPSSIEHALSDVDALFLVSSPRIALDFHDVVPGKGREADHIAAIEAARRAGVQHVYYTSLAFSRPSKAGVMRAHIYTEEYLEQMGGTMGWTVLREGLYNESWPLYLGHWGLGEDERTEVLIGGDSRITWTGIADLGLANALVLAAPREEYKSRTLYLSNSHDAKSMREIAQLVSKDVGREVSTKVVERKEHEDYYIEKNNMDAGLIKWWASTYDALRDEECLIKDDTFAKLLASKGITPKSMEETIQEMIQAAHQPK